jgi:hypothetical protein
MTKKTPTGYAVWERHLGGIADELLRLSIACNVRLRDAGVIERILRGDSTVCGRSNDVAFDKLRKLLMATYDSLGKSIDRIGGNETREIAEAIAKQVQSRRDSGGNLPAGDD